jgi:hypothetical protein
MNYDASDSRGRIFFDVAMICNTLQLMVHIGGAPLVGIF